MNGKHAPESTETDDRHERLAAFVRARRRGLSVYLKGFAMGSAATVPGVSGGTVALVVGIYDRFIRALTQLDTAIVVLALGSYRSAGRTRFREAAVTRDLVFLAVLFAGIASAVFTLARLISGLLSAYPGPTFAFFGGLIAASAVVLYDRRWLSRPRHGLAAAAGFALAFVVAGASETGAFPETLWMVFFTGAVAISGLVLPGLSGSFILLLLGQYEHLTGVLTSFGDGLGALATGGGADGLASDVAVIGTFGVGAVVGFLTTAYAVRGALRRYPGATFAFLVALMFGALRYPIAAVLAATDPEPVPVGTVVLAALAGATLVFALERTTTSIGYDAYT